MDDQVEDKSWEKNIGGGISQVVEITQELLEDTIPIEIDPSELEAVLEHMGEQVGEKEVENVEPPTVVTLEGNGGDTTQGDKQTKEVRVKVELVDTCANDPLGPTPATRPMEEVIVKK